MRKLTAMIDYERYYVYITNGKSLAQKRRQKQ